MKDDKLLKILKTDPERGMAIIIKQYAGLLYLVVKSKMLSDVFCAADTESCVADTFSEFFLNIDKFSLESGSIKAYLCVIARNNATDYVRRHYKTKDDLPFDSETMAQITDDFSVEGDWEDKALRKRLIDTVKNLGKPDSEIIIRKFFLAQSSKEIAHIMHMSVSNVDTRTHRAIAKLRTYFGGDD